MDVRFWCVKSAPALKVGPQHRYSTNFSVLFKIWDYDMRSDLYFTNHSNFQWLVVMNRGSKTQLQVDSNLNLTLWPPVPHIFRFFHFLLSHQVPPFKQVKDKMWHQSAIYENSWPPFCQIWIIVTHLKLWIASARHNFNWVKIQIE